MRIGDILAHKPGPAVVSIGPDEPVRALVALLAEHNIGACVVSGDGATVAGIVSERDVVRHLVDADVLEHPVSSIMTEQVATCDEDAVVDDLMGLMTRRRIRHVPVLRQGSVIGLVSIGDLVKHRIDELTFERDQLEVYVQHG